MDIAARPFLRQAIEGAGAAARVPFRSFTTMIPAFGTITSARLVVSTSFVTPGFSVALP